MDTFRKELEALINAHSLENGSDTPDFILAKFLTDCLEAFDETTRTRDNWWGYKLWRDGEVKAPTDETQS